MASVRANLQRLRKKRGFNDAFAFAKEIGLLGKDTRSRISRWEAGKANFSVSDLARICRVLKVSADTMLDLGPETVGNKVLVPASEIDEMHSKLQDLLRQIERLRRPTPNDRTGGEKERARS